MNLVVYDRNPGEGFMQRFLALSWALGCWIQKALGRVDAYYGAESWTDALAWLETHAGPFTSIQYWGHGQPGMVGMAGKGMPNGFFSTLKPKLLPETLIWFRCCLVFQGEAGHKFSQKQANALGCRIAGHTVVIGPWQGGLHTRGPNEAPSWDVTEGEKPPALPPHLFPVFSNTIFCLRTTVPKGW